MKIRIVLVAVTAAICLALFFMALRIRQSRGELKGQIARVVRREAELREALRQEAAARQSVPVPFVRRSVSSPAMKTPPLGSLSELASVRPGLLDLWAKDLVSRFQERYGFLTTKLGMNATESERFYAIMVNGTSRWLEVGEAALAEGLTIKHPGVEVWLAKTWTRVRKLLRRAGFCHQRDGLQCSSREQVALMHSFGAFCACETTFLVRAAATRLRIHGTEHQREQLIVPTRPPPL